MILIVDSNRVIAALMRDSSTRKVIMCPYFQFYAPDLLLHEIKKHKDIILEKSGLSDYEFHTVLNEIFDRITIVPRRDIAKHITVAHQIIGHEDPNDVPFVALALTIPNDGIWTEDKHFRNQSKIKIWSTNQLLGIIKKLK